MAQAFTIPITFWNQLDAMFCLFNFHIFEKSLDTASAEIKHTNKINPINKTAIIFPPHAILLKSKFHVKVKPRKVLPHGVS